MKVKEFEDVPVIVRDYLKNYLKVARNRQDTTIKEYYYDIKDILQYIEWMKNKNPKYIDNLKFDKYNNKSKNIFEFKKIDISNLDLEFFKNISTNDIYEYLYDKNTKAISRSRKISSIKSFFNYLCNKAKLIDKNPCVGLESPKLEKRLPKYLKLDEAQNLLHSIDGDFRSRDYAIITLFMNCGLRLSELVGININHIKGDSLTVIGKGNKERQVHLNKACLNAINEYMKDRPIDNLKDRNALFISKQLNRISPRMIEILVKRYIVKSGLDPKKYTPHKLRHTAATLMHKYGHVDIRTLQQVLGHETIATTQIYTHIDNEEVISAIDNNPLNRI